MSGNVLKYAMIGGVIIGVTVGLTEYIVMPSFHYDLRKNSRSSASITYKYNMYPQNTKISHHNTDCLVKKGYTIDVAHDRHIYNDTVIIQISKTDLTISQLLEDCKTCSTETEIMYEHMPVFSGTRSYDYIKRLQWSSCRMRRELK